MRDLDFSKREEGGRNYLKLIEEFNSESIDQS